MINYSKYLEQRESVKLLIEYTNKKNKYNKIFKKMNFKSYIDRIKCVA